MVISFLETPNYVNVGCARPASYSGPQRELFVADVSIGPTMDIERRERRLIYASTLDELATRVRVHAFPTHRDEVLPYDVKARPQKIDRGYYWVSPVTPQQLSAFSQRYFDKTGQSEPLHQLNP